MNKIRTMYHIEQVSFGWIPSYKIVFDYDYDLMTFSGIDAYHNATKLCAMLQGAYQLGFLYGRQDAIDYLQDARIAQR